MNFRHAKHSVHASLRTLYNIHYANKKKIRFENYLLDKSSHPAFVRGTLWLQKPLGLNRYTPQMKHNQ